jgi:hypothetical protein
MFRAVARSKNPGGLVVLGGDNVPPLVEIGLTDLTKTGGAKAPQAPPGDGPVWVVSLEIICSCLILSQGNWIGQD